jgi:hypothetical protein
MLGGAFIVVPRSERHWRAFRVTSIRRFYFALLFLCAPLFSKAQEFSPDIERIENAFVQTRELPIVNRIVDLPTDIIERFQPLLNWDRMAEFGAQWSEGDVSSGDEDEKVTQHVFSGVSADFVAIVYLYGGITGRSTILVLAERGVPGVCTYALGSGFGVPYVLDYLRQAVQGGYLFRNEEVVACRYQPNY